MKSVIYHSGEERRKKEMNKDVLVKIAKSKLLTDDEKSKAIASLVKMNAQQDEPDFDDDDQDDDYPGDDGDDDDDEPLFVSGDIVFASSLPDSDHENVVGKVVSNRKGIVIADFVIENNEKVRWYCDESDLELAFE